MNSAETYQVGVNLGGWISQYRKFDAHHFDTFIQERDIEQIAGWGMDHVRLPVDYPVLEDDRWPGAYREEGFSYIDHCLDWCQRHGLKLILDLHKAPGFAFDKPQDHGLFNDPAMAERAIHLWAAIARRYQDKGDDLVFELLNEVVLPDSGPWNRMAQKLLSAIRQVDVDRLVLWGGNQYNIPSTLRELEVPDDPNIFFTFHFYEPMPFTHQKAPWVRALFEMNQTVEYPGFAGDIEEFLAHHPQHTRFLEPYKGLYLDKSVLAYALQPALDFREKTGRVIYCGEYGVIDQAPVPSSLRWHQDLVSLLRENKIGRAVWSYKQMDFGLVDENSQVVHPELVKIVSQR